MESKTILLTGATGGLGKRILSKSLENGHKVLMITRNENKTLALINEILTQYENPDIRYFIADFRSQAWISKCFDYIEAEGLTPNSLVNNAAINTPLGNSWEIHIKEWQQHFAVNFFTPVALISQLIPIFIKNGGGSIVNVSGGGATKPMPYFAPYSASKAALVRYTETIAAELVRYKISVNSVAPGFLATGIHSASLEADSPIPRPIKNKIKEEFDDGGKDPDLAANLITKLIENKNHSFTGNLVSALWDNLQDSDFRADTLLESRFKLRRIE